MTKEDIQREFPSECYYCVHRRRAASEENEKRGYVGCKYPTEYNVSGKEFDYHTIAEKAEHIAEGWVDLRAHPFEKTSGLITNFQLLTLKVKSCSKFSM